MDIQTLVRLPKLYYMLLMNIIICLNHLNNNLSINKNECTGSTPNIKTT